MNKPEESDTPGYPELTDISYIHKCKQRGRAKEGRTQLAFQVSPDSYLCRNGAVPLLKK